MGQYYLIMIFIQPIRKNDIIPEAGKQIELGKTFMNYHNWETGEIDITLIYNSLSDSDIHFDKKIIQTTLKVRGNERGGDRIGVDCKEYSEGRGTGFGPWKRFFVEDLKISEAKGYFVLEDRTLNGRIFNLYYIPDGALFKQFYEKFGNIINIAKEDDFDFDDFDSQQIDNTLPLQQIFYGAHGTGKSHEIKKLTKGESVIRTTFHPDSDYSTFVGCYKPTMDEVDTQVVPVVVKSGISLQDPGTYKEKRITYKFVMQAFLKAYLGAWKKWADVGDDGVAPQFLVIEEINRGNCAQIFGDLFQLLDRSDNNFSEYSIEADTDLQQEIERAFKEHKDYKLNKAIDAEGAVKDYISNYDSTLSEDIQSGRILLLPPNLYIWATMNTSDQSLFPIDSAFKRRWEWKYIKIAWPYKKNEDGSFKTDENGEKVHFNYSIEGGHDWWAFLQQINAIIDKMTNSADKQLGYFFAKAKDDIISYDTFVSKVCFYLWNDIFKTYALDEQQGDLFKFAKKIKDKDGNEKEVIGHLSFPEFYDGDGNVVPDVARQFIEHVMAWNTEGKKENS
jgi:hypothetical protein